MINTCLTSALRLSLCMTIFSLYGCKTTVTVQCPDGPAIVQKKPDKMYPTFVKTSQTDLKATIDILEKIKIADLDFSTKTQVTELRQKLDQFSSQFEIVAKSSYFAYNVTPCDLNVRREHFRILNDLSALQKFKVEAEKLVSSGNIAGIDDAKVLSLINNLKKESDDKGTGFKTN